MCGLLGALAESQTLPVIADSFRWIAYRGKLHGSFVDTKLALFCTRLARTGCRYRPQPILTETNDIFCLNGEIYNAKELSSAKFNSIDDPSDTERLAAWFAEDRRNLRRMSLLQGEYALAFIPADRRSVVLARDPFGSKPLYWGRKRSIVVFGSSSKAVADVLHGTPKIDSLEFSDMFWFGTSASGSCFSEINAVRPGQILTVSAEGQEGTSLTAADAPHEDLLESLRMSVKQRVGDPSRTVVAFSGGIDSSLIYKLSPSSAIKRLTLFPDRDDGEEPQDDRVQYTSELVRHALGPYCQVSEKPLISLTGVGIYLLAQRARDLGFEVSLSGEGADEVFAGYAHYYERSNGHPHALYALQQRDTLFRIMKAKSSRRDSPFVKRLKNSKDRSEWLRLDRQYRLPQHLCSSNVDIPTLMAGIESRLPYLGVQRFAVKRVTGSHPKPQLHALARLVGITASPKSGLAIGCGVLADFIPAYIDEVVWKLIADVLEIDSHTIGATVMDVWTKIRRGNLPRLLENYLLEALARFVLASWSTSRMLEGMPAIRPERVYTKISKDRDLQIHQWLPI
jgi:asparagine synthetase B (glutamine-hydrolysing)